MKIIKSLLLLLQCTVYPAEEKKSFDSYHELENYIKTSNLVEFENLSANYLTQFNFAQIETLHKAAVQQNEKIIVLWHIQSLGLWHDFKIVSNEINCQAEKNWQNGSKAHGTFTYIRQERERLSKLPQISDWHQRKNQVLCLMSENEDLINPLANLPQTMKWVDVAVLNGARLGEFLGLALQNSEKIRDIISLEFNKYRKKFVYNPRNRRRCFAIEKNN